MPRSAVNWHAKRLFMGTGAGWVSEYQSVLSIYTVPSHTHSPFFTISEKRSLSDLVSVATVAKTSDWTMTDLGRGLGMVGCVAVCCEKAVS